MKSQLASPGPLPNTAPAILLPEEEGPGARLMFGSYGSEPGQIIQPHSVAIGSDGVVYVTDYCNHRVLLFSAEGQFISTFGSEGSQHGQLYRPTGICVDSTNTVYVTGYNHRVSVYTSSGQFIKCFGKQGSGEEELDSPEGVAVARQHHWSTICV